MNEAMKLADHRDFEALTIDEKLDVLTLRLYEFTTAKSTLKFCARTSLYCAALYASIGFSLEALAALVVADLVVANYGKALLNYTAIPQLIRGIQP